MAVATSIALAAIAAGASGFQIYKGIKQKKEGEDQLANLETPELINRSENIAISTVGSDAMREESQKNSANMVDAARAGGVRSVMSSLPKIAALNNAENQQTRKYLDDQVIDREYAIAKEYNRIDGIKEHRYQGEIDGLGQKIASGQQDIWSGIRGIGSSLMSLSGGVGEDGGGITPGLHTNTFKKSNYQPDKNPFE